MEVKSAYLGIHHRIKLTISPLKNMNYSILIKTTVEIQMVYGIPLDVIQMTQKVQSRGRAVHLSKMTT